MWKYTGKAFARNFCDTWKNARVVWHVELHVPPQAQQQQTLVVLWPWMVLCSPFLSQQLGSFYNRWLVHYRQLELEKHVFVSHMSRIWVLGTWVIYTCDWCKDDRSMQQCKQPHTQLFFLMMCFFARSLFTPKGFDLVGWLWSSLAWTEMRASAILLLKHVKPATKTTCVCVCVCGVMNIALWWLFKEKQIDFEETNQKKTHTHQNSFQDLPKCHGKHPQTKGSSQIGCHFVSETLVWRLGPQLLPHHSGWNTT